MKWKMQWIRKKPYSFILLAILPFAGAGALLVVKNLYAAFLMPYVPPCLLRTVTGGLLCPACGMTHAVFAMCRLDIVTAAKENIMILFVAIIALLWYVELWMKAFGSTKKIIPRSGKFWVAVLGMWMVYAILRNVL